MASKKLIVYLIVTLIIVSAIFLLINKANASTNNSCAGMIIDEGNCLNQINKKIDWNNCAVAHKDARGYGYGDWGENTAHSYKDLVKYCGEMP